eukprot:13231736-Alexandrium_andersonii.AAC.1
MLPVESTRRSSPDLPAVVLAKRAVNNGMLTTMHTCIIWFMSIRSSGGPIPRASYDISQGGMGISGTYIARSAPSIPTHP